MWGDRSVVSARRDHGECLSLLLSNWKAIYVLLNYFKQLPKESYSVAFNSAWSSHCYADVWICYSLDTSLMLALWSSCFSNTTWKQIFFSCSLVCSTASEIMLNYALKRHDQLLNHSQFSTVTHPHSQVLQEQRWKHYFKHPGLYYKPSSDLSF